MAIKENNGKVTVDSVNPHNYKADRSSAQLRQKITKVYESKPTVRGNLFSKAQLGISNQVNATHTEERVDWVDVPLNMTVAELEAHIATNAPDCCIQRTLSLKPILTTRELQTIEMGTKTLEEIAEKQLVRKGEGGEIVLYKGLPTYKRLQFYEAFVEDNDLREVNYVAMQVKANNLQPVEGELEVKF